MLCARGGQGEDRKGRKRETGSLRGNPGMSQFILLLLFFYFLSSIAVSDTVRPHVCVGRAGL